MPGYRQSGPGTRYPAARKPAPWYTCTHNAKAPVPGYSKCRSPRPPSSRVPRALRHRITLLINCRYWVPGCPQTYPLVHLYPQCKGPGTRVPQNIPGTRVNYKGALIFKLIVGIQILMYPQAYQGTPHGSARVPPSLPRLPTRNLPGCP